MSTLSEIVYSHLFPGGMIPLACKNNLPAIDARISEIEFLAAGKPFDGSKRAASKLLTEQVVQLRDSCSPPMPWAEIARRIGGKMTTDAARNRYVDYKAAQKAKAMQQEGYAALSGQAIQEGRYTTPPEVREKIESSDHISTATNMIDRGNDHLVEPDEMMPNADDAEKIAGARNVLCEETISPEPHKVLTLGTVREGRRILRRMGLAATAEDGKCKENETVISAAAQPALLDAKPPQVEEATVRNSQMVQKTEDVKPALKIPHSEDERIFRERESGKPIKDIADDLRKDGYKATPANVQSRYYTVQAQHAREQAQPKQPEATQDPSLPGAEGAQTVARANPRGTPEEKPEPKSISRVELDDRVWKAWKAEKNITKITDNLNAEGYYVGEERVRRSLLQQGAKL
jgi:hypothetical protein